MDRLPSVTEMNSEPGPLYSKFAPMSGDRKKLEHNPASQKTTVLGPSFYAVIDGPRRKTLSIIMGMGVI